MLKKSVAKNFNFESIRESLQKKFPKLKVSYKEFFNGVHVIAMDDFNLYMGRSEDWVNKCRSLHSLYKKDKWVIVYLEKNKHDFSKKPPKG